jgi:hypothetical protein
MYYKDEKCMKSWKKTKIMDIYVNIHKLKSKLFEKGLYALVTHFNCD